jgi:hypothetical protein
MGYADARATAQIRYHLAIEISKRTPHANISMVSDRSSNRWEYTKGAPAGKPLQLQQRSRDNQEGEGGG